MEFGAFVRQRRIEKQLLLREVAQYTGFTISMISKMESGERLPKYFTDSFNLYADILDVNREELALRVYVEKTGTEADEDQIKGASKILDK